jgi:tetratricopeptide (TPR) repeat protein
MAEDAACPSAPMAVDAVPVTTYVGIDLGVLNVVIASSSAAEPTLTHLATNEVSNRATPCTVGFDGRLRLIGDSAEAKVTQLPKQTLTHVAAMLGSADEARANWERFNCLYGFTEGGKIGPIQFGDREDLEFHAASCLAAHLQKAVSFTIGDAAVEAGAPQCFELAISASDSWGEAQLANLRAAIDILGWKPELVHVLPFSYAIATAYAQRVGQKLGADEEKRIVAFADVGFSQTTISIAKFSRPAEGAEKTDLIIEPCAAATASVGTHSLCSSIAEHLIKDCKEPVDMRSKRGARLMTALFKALKELSMLPDTKVAIECFFPDESDFVKDVTRAQLEEWARPQFEQIAELTNKALSDAGISAADVHSVELCGGGIRIPRVQQMMSELFPEAETADDAAPDLKRLRFGLDGASAMATGTTLYAAGKRALPSKWDFVGQKSAFEDGTLNECRELEAWMYKTNQAEVLRLEKGNEFESYIYEVRSWLSGPDRAMLKPEASEPILDKEAMWFEDAQYDDATTLEMYTEHLSGLKRQLEEHGAEFFAKRQKEREEKDKFLDEEAERERQRRKDLGMDDDKDDRKMAKSERIKMAGKNKDEGNTVFKAGNLEDAAGRYQRALQHLKKFYMLDLSPDDKAEGDAIFLSVQLNLAQVFLKLAAKTEKEVSKDKAEAHYQKAKAAADEALTIDADNVKAKFRRASAMEKLGDIDGATKEVKAALKLDEENTDLQKFKERLDKLAAIQNAKAKKMYGKMFG